MNKIDINPLTILFTSLVIITGMFKEFTIIFSIIIIHEIGHLLASKIFDWNLDKISIYPFGGCVKFNEKLNRPLYEELIILLSGPFIQIIYLLLIYILYKYNLISLRNYLIFKEYNLALLSFNLLPIYPLDGGIIFNIINSYILSFRKSNIVTIMISYIFILLVLFKIRNVNLNTMVILLGYESFIYLKRQNYLYNRLLLERYIDNYEFKKLKRINNKNNFYRDKRHIIKDKNKYITEKEYLKMRFNN